MNTCVLLRYTGEIEKLQLDHKKLKEYFESDITFVGAIDDCQVVAVGKSNYLENKNILCIDEDMFDVPVFGDVLLIGSDKDGEALDVNYKEVVETLQKSLNKVDVKTNFDNDKNGSTIE